MEWPIARIAIFLGLAGCGGLAEQSSVDSGSERAPAARDAGTDARPSRVDAGSDSGDAGRVDAGVDGPSDVASPVCVGDASDGWLPSPAGSPVERLYGGVWGSGPSDVWAVGRSAIEHWNGSAWSASPVPPPTAGDYYLAGVWGSASDDVWALGSGAGGISTVILHWNGTAWSFWPTPKGEPSGTATEGHGLAAVWGTGPGDVWAVGTDNRMGTVLHWDGSRWSYTSLSSVELLFGVWGSASSDVWAVGSDAWANPIIVHWDGHAWTVSFSVPNDGGMYAGYYPWSSTKQLNAVWGSGPNDVWGAGESCFDPGGGGTGGYGPSCDPILMHWDGASWSSTTPPGGVLSGVWGTGPCDVWAVGATVSDDSPVILHWDCSTWSASKVPRTKGAGALGAVWGSGCELWAVGGDAIFEHL